MKIVFRRGFITVWEPGVRTSQVKLLDSPYADLNGWWNIKDRVEIAIPVISNEDGLLLIG